MKNINMNESCVYWVIDINLATRTSCILADIQSIKCWLKV